MGPEINSSNDTETSPKKRVLFVITQSEFGGAQRFLHTLITRLDKNHYDILVAAGPAESGTTNQELRIRNYELLDRLEKEGVKTVRLKHLQREMRPISDLMALSELKKVVKQFNPDTLFLLSSKAGFLGSFVSKFLTSRPTLYAPRSKIIYRIGGWSFNDPWPNWKKWLWILLEKISANWKDVIVVNNEYDLEQANKLKIRPKEKTVLIHNGIDVYKTEFLPKEDARLMLFEKASKTSGRVFQAETTIGTIANFYPPKGLKYLIEAAEYFKNKDNVVFMIIGDGQEREELENLIEQKGLKKKVLLLGQIPDAYKLLNAFDIFVLPSVKEGFPWVVIEAMTAKLPVVATEVGAVPEIIENGKNGFIIEPARPEQIVAKIQDLLNDERLRQELGIQAHQTVLFKFSLDKMIKQIEDLL